MPGGFAPFDGAGQLDGAAEQQQLFGERSFTRIWVRNDCESAAPGRFVRNRAHAFSNAMIQGNNCLFYRIITRCARRGPL